MAVRHNMLGTLPTTTERTFTTLADAALGSTSFSVHENILNPDAVVPWHQHAVDEVIVCTAGVGECTFRDADTQRYEAGSVLVIPAGTLHTLRNAGPDRLHHFAILGGPAAQTKWLDGEGSVAKPNAGGR